MIFRSGPSGEVGHFSSAVLLLGADGGHALRHGAQVALPLVVLDSLGTHEPDRVKEDVVKHLLERVCPVGTQHSLLQLEVVYAKGCQNDTVSCGPFTALYAARVCQEYGNLSSWPPSKSELQAMADRIAREVTVEAAQQAKQEFRSGNVLWEGRELAIASGGLEKYIRCLAASSSSASSYLTKPKPLLIA